jgi:ADP-ribose pyrophosphatase
VKYKILKKENLFQNYFLNVENVFLEVERFEGESMKVQRVAFQKRGVCAVLIEIKETREIVLVEQFRYSAIGKNSGWIQEVVAGILEKKEDPLQGAIREAKEETGYLLDDVEKICDFYPTPGISNQIVHLYFASVSEHARIANYQKLWDKEEDLKIYYYKKEQLPQLLKTQIVDAKTILALQWYLLRK